VVGMNALLIGVSVLAVLPLVYMTSLSLQTMEQIIRQGGLIPAPLTFGAYVAAFTRMPFALYLKNSLVITSMALIGAFVSNCLGAYGFARFRFPGREVAFTVLLSTLMLPGVVRLVPTYILFQQLGWINTFLPLIVPAYFGSPFYVFLLRQFFRQIPEDLFDAAKIDGAGELRILSQIVLPSARPALATMLIFSAQGSWNDFMGPLLYLKDASMRTLALGLYAFRSEPQGIPSWNNLMAIAVFMTMPVLLVFAMFQRYFIQGLALSGVKG
jgi:ABC-type glycerol-3-phosphate transport system permease component